MFKIFVIEDDKTLSDLLTEDLKKWGYQSSSVSDFNNIVKEVLEYNPHLILLDINLPSFDGFYWCKKIRDVTKAPIMFISSRGSNMDIIMAMNMGGDEYIQKPFSTDVLIAKINAVLRRTYSYKEKNPEVIVHGNVTLNITESTITYDNKKSELTKNEFRIMYLLFKNFGAVISRDKLMRDLWENESFVDENTLAVNINRLRKKLSDIGLNDFIETRKGQGYIIK